MAHNFNNVHSNLKIAMEGLVAVDSLRVSLNRASLHFKMIDDNDFGHHIQLKSEFRALRVRLRRHPNSDHSYAVKCLDTLDSKAMIILAENLLSFMRKVDSVDKNDQIVSVDRSMLAPYVIRDPGPDNMDDDRSLD